MTTQSKEHIPTCTKDKHTASGENQQQNVRIGKGALVEEIAHVTNGMTTMPSTE